MGRKVELLTRDEREQAEDGAYEASPITAGITPLGDADSERSWDDWIDDLKQSEATGTIRAHRLPVDADGNPQLGKGTRQIYLGSWPHQLYAFDDLLAKLTKEFLKPGELAHIKLTGTAAGHRGVMFSRVVALQKADGPSDATAGNGETVGQLFKVMQESQERQLATFREVMAPVVPTTPQRGGMEVVKDIASIVTPLLAPVIAAYIARPTTPRTELGDLIAAMSQMKDFMSGSPADGNDESNTTLGIIRAVAPALPQLLQLLNQGTSAPRPIQALPRATPPPMPTIDPSQPTRIPPPVAAPPPTQPTMSPTLDNAMLAQLKPQIDQLAQLAAQNADPVEVAKLTISMLPEAMDDTLANLVADPHAFARLAVLSPDMTKHVEWFERLRVALHSELFEADDKPQT